jgi:hypothetical protein
MAFKFDVYAILVLYSCGALLEHECVIAALNTLCLRPCGAALSDDGHLGHSVCHSFIIGKCVMISVVEAMQSIA